MVGFLDVDASDAVPIWKQIEDGVRRLAASGSLAAGSAVPSVRDLARELRVNPATVAKAYQRLTEAGVLVVRRGEGTFVAERPAREVAADRQQILADGASRYAEVARTVKASKDEAIGALATAWARAAAPGEGDES